jgi:hypothetical protein
MDAVVFWWEALKHLRKEICFSYWAWFNDMGVFIIENICICLLMDQNEMSSLYRGPSIDASYQVSYHLAKWFQRKSCFRNRTIRNKNCLWRPCLLTDQNRMSIFHRGPSIDASYQVSDHLAKRFQKRRFLEINQSETRISCGGHVCKWIGTKWALFIEDRP